MFCFQGSPGDVVCLDGKVTSCQCARSKCRWGETDMPCYDGSSEHNSTSTFLHEDISSALDTPSSCLRTNCNCVAYGNHITQQPASSFQDCGMHSDIRQMLEASLHIFLAALCNNFQPACKDWTYVPSQSTCFILTNCNNIRCGYPFNGWVSGPRNCPGFYHHYKIFLILTILFYIQVNRLNLKEDLLPHHSLSSI